MLNASYLMLLEIRYGVSVAQHFLLSPAAKTLSLASVARMTDDEARATFARIRWSDNGGKPTARAAADAPEHLVRREGQVRFEYVASGTEILFRDHADPAPRSRRVFAFHRPGTLQRWLADDATIRRRLQAMPPPITEGLRDCQTDAVRALEASLAADRPRALIQMATGAGKTFTPTSLPATRSTSISSGSRTPPSTTPTCCRRRRRSPQRSWRTWRRRWSGSVG
jgi:hypothetical protein